MKIYTSCWFSRLPPEIVRVSISRGTPRGQPAGYRKLPDLYPGPWFKSVTPQRYLELYSEILSRLDPLRVVARLEEIGGGRDVALLCFESVGSCASGDKWCHRHIAAQWLNDTIDAGVAEHGAPGLDWWAFLRNRGIAPPSYAAAK